LSHYNPAEKFEAPNLPFINYNFFASPAQADFAQSDPLHRYGKTCRINSRLQSTTARRLAKPDPIALNSLFFAFRDGAFHLPGMTH
jgi:hypothetical protein